MAKTKEKVKKEKTNSGENAETKIKASFVSPETKVQERRAEVITKKPEELDEEIEDEFLEEDMSPAFDRINYPFLRRLPSIRIQPIATNLEIELDDIPVAKKEEETVDQYKSVPEKNYAINQKYELPGGASYDSITPKEIKAPPSPSLTPNFSDQMNAGRGFGNQPTTTGYPGQDNERKYDSGLEQQTRSDQDRRRREM